MTSALPRELVSLVHHVQLNQSGWWTTAVERLVLAALWRLGGIASPATISKEIEGTFGVRLPLGTLPSTIERLRSREDVLQLRDARLKLPEARITEYEAMRLENERRDEYVKERFAKALAESGCGCDPEETWDLFRERWLEPAVAAAGARTYELVAGAPKDWAAVADLKVFTDALPVDERDAGREAAGRFFDPSDATMRSYLLALMDAYFIVEACALSAATVKAISSLTAKHPSFVVFLDTNVVFSMLGLHGQAAKDASQGVFGVAKQVADRGVALKFYVTPSTIEEALGVLRYELDRLSALRIMPNLAAQVLAHSTLSGIHLALVEAVERAGKVVHAQEFLGPYVNGLKTVLQAYGVQLYNDAKSTLVDDAAVLDDVETQFHFEQKKYSASGKPRLALRHDVALWHFVSRKRPPFVESPSDAHYWVLTEDRRFTGFDAHKRRHLGVPVCLHPLAFAQLLEFWNGRSDETAAALVGGLRLAMLGSSMDKEAERATMSIIAALSRFEGVEDLPSETIAHLLVNDALRQKLEQRVGNPEESFELVRDELMAEHQRVVEERTEATARAARLADKVLAESRTRSVLEDRAVDAEKVAASLQGSLAAERERVREREGELQAIRASLATLQQRERDLGDTVNGLTARLAARDEEDRVRAIRRKFAVRVVFMPVLGLLLLWVVLLRWHAVEGTFLGDPRVGYSVLAVAAAAWSWIAHDVAQRRVETERWWLSLFLRVVRWLLAGVAVLGAGVGILGNALYDRSGLKPTVEALPLGEMTRSGSRPRAMRSQKSLSDVNESVTSKAAGRAPTAPGDTSTAAVRGR